MKHRTLSAQRLRDLVSYSPETGKFLWLPRPVSDFKDERAQKVWNSRYASKAAFTTQLNGYLHGRVDGRRYPAHRLAWLFAKGVFPADEVDHINGDRSDNRLSNLRAVSRAENARNLKVYRGNRTGVPGVSAWPETGLWRAYIYHGGEQIHLGTFPSFLEAVQNRKAAEESFKFHKNHGRTT